MKCKYKERKWTKITRALNLPCTWFCSRDKVFLKAFWSMLWGNGPNHLLVYDEGHNSWSPWPEESTAASQHALFTALLLFRWCFWAEKPLQARGNDNTVIKLSVVIYSSSSSKFIQPAAPPCPGPAICVSTSTGSCHIFIFTEPPMNSSFPVVWINASKVIGSGAKGHLQTWCHVRPSVKA